MNVFVLLKFKLYLRNLNQPYYHTFSTRNMLSRLLVILLYIKKRRFEQCSNEKRYVLIFIMTAGVVRPNPIGRRFAAVQTQVGHVTPQPVPPAAIGGKTSEPDPAALRTKRYPISECELCSDTRRCGGEISLDVCFIGEPGCRRDLIRIGGPRPECSVIHVRESEADANPNVRRKAARIIGEVEVHVAEKSMRCNAADAFARHLDFAPQLGEQYPIHTGDRYVLMRRPIPGKSAALRRGCGL